jgi:hypothetical protein
MRAYPSSVLPKYYIYSLTLTCNSITYYTGQIFVETGVSAETAIYASFGAGALNFGFALPAIKYIDTVGRRPLLMGSLISMAVFLLWTGFSFYAKDDTTRLALVAVGLYA